MFQLINVDLSYGSESLFKNLSLDIATGGVLGLVGRNGAGKTSLLKLLAGLIRPNSGKCLSDGVPVFERNVRQLQDIFYIPDEFELPKMKIRTFVNLVSGFYPKFDASRFESLLTGFLIDSGKVMSAQSYGQKKKILLAIALASGCRTIIFDEPTNGLDISAQKHLRKTLVEIMTPDRLFVISTHHVREFEGVLDSLLVIEKGAVLTNRSLSEIASHLTTKVSFSDERDSDAFYCEETPAGKRLLVSATEEDVRFDLEFFYNALLENPLAIEKFLQEKSEVL